MAWLLILRERLHSSRSVLRPCACYQPVEPSRACVLRPLAPIRPCCLLPVRILDEEVEEGGPASSAVCAALLRRLTGLRSLRLSSGEQEVSWEALQQLSCLATGALTSLDLERMYTVGNEVGAEVQGGAGEVAFVGAARCFTAYCGCSSALAQAPLLLGAG